MTGNNGCSHHADCLTCPFPECIKGKRIAKTSPEERARRSCENAKAYYWRNREAILDKQAKMRGGKRLQVEAPQIAHQKRMALYKKGMNDPKIAQELGCCRHTIWEWRKKNGLPTNCSGRPRKVATEYES